MGSIFTDICCSRNLQCPLAFSHWYLICLSSGFQEAAPEGGKIQMHFEELLKSNTTLFVVTVYQ